jgi:Astacin (Peptidase family M12A)
MKNIHWLAMLGIAALFSACQSNSNQDSSAVETQPFQATFPGGEILAGHGVVRGDDLFVDGDMVIPLKSSAVRLTTQGNVITNFQKWPDATQIPIIWDPALDFQAQQKILRSMAPWREIGVDFVNAGNVGHAVYITTTHPQAQSWQCAARVGYQGAGVRSYLWAGPNCRNRDLVHEWGHILGYFHEHQRADRDQYVTITSTSSSDAVKGQMYGGYDFGSIMHYDAFYRFNDGTVDYNRPWIFPKDGRALTSFGFNETLSADDIAMTRALYPEIVNRPQPIPKPKR